MTVYLFAGLDYYPEGGWSDFRGSFATEHEAREAMEAGEYDRLEWAQTVTDAQHVQEWSKAGFYTPPKGVKPWVRA